MVRKMEMMRKTFCAATVVAALLVSSAAYAQTADEIVTKNLAAKGGAEKLRALQTLRQTGTVTIQGMAATMTTSFRRPSTCPR